MAPTAGVERHGSDSRSGASWLKQQIWSVMAQTAGLERHGSDSRCGASWLRQQVWSVMAPTADLERHGSDSRCGASWLRQQVWSVMTPTAGVERHGSDSKCAASWLRQYIWSVVAPTARLERHRSTDLLSWSQRGYGQTDLKFGAASKHRIVPKGPRCVAPVPCDPHQQATSLRNLDYLQETLAKTLWIPRHAHSWLLPSIPRLVARGLLNINIPLLEADTSVRGNEQP
jgi:hypothetical protein